MNNNHLRLLATCLTLATPLLAASLTAAAQTLTPSGDSYVRGGSAANNNYGDIAELGVRTANNALNTYWSYIKFDTSAVSGVVRSARLRLSARLYSSGSLQSNLYAVSADWTENTLTWNNKPALGAQLGSFTVASTSNLWHEIDITAHLQAQQGQATVSFALVSPEVSSKLISVQSRESANPPQLVLEMNSGPTVALTSPASGAVYTAPASIALGATAADSDGTIQKVEFFHGGTNLIATVTAAPYTYNWTNVGAGSYSLTARATDNLGTATTSAPVNVTVNAAVAQMYFIHADHLNSPRVITNQTQQVVWRWDNDDPFGANMANENPSGLGIFTCNLRLPGQYFDKETNNHYNYYRDYSPEIGRYIKSDPIGLNGGLNTYGYVEGNPLSKADPQGLASSSIPTIPIAPPLLPPPPVGGSTLGGGMSLPWGPAIGAGIAIGLGYLLNEACDNDDECKKKRDLDESLCVAIAGRYGPQGVAICMRSAATRYSECLRFGVDGITTPLHGVDTPL